LAAAVIWSEAGAARLRLSSATPDAGHSGYRTEGSRAGRVIGLQGPGSIYAPEDAPDGYAALRQLPPAPSAAPPCREALVALFDRVSFRPLSIAVLAQQLKTCTLSGFPVAPTRSHAPLRGSGKRSFRAGFPSRAWEPVEPVKQSLPSSRSWSFATREREGLRRDWLTRSSVGAMADAPASRDLALGSVAETRGA
jgi:hypothetical protein